MKELSMSGSGMLWANLGQIMKELLGFFQRVTHRIH
jgi:hypothetical protein